MCAHNKLEMKKIYDKYPKEKVSSLPRELFPGRIIVIISPNEAERAVDYLLTKPLLGFDTETRPSFKRGRQYQVALLQVATHDECFLFRLNHLGMCNAIQRLLQDCSVPLVGLSVNDDMRALHGLGDFTPGVFIEIQREIKTIGIQDLGLQRIYANLFGKRIAKGQQLSNWEADSLTQAQQLYAATDAWTCLLIYEEILRLRKSHDYIIEKTVEPNIIPINDK